MLGKKCYLSPMDMNDAEKFTGWLNDLEMLSNLHLYSSVINVENEKTLLEKLSKGHNYSIVDADKNEVIGNCGFMGIDNVNQNAEMGIFIGNKDYWNRGYGTEAVALLLDYGFKALNLHNVLIRVYDFNQRARRCCEKVGFREVGIRRKALLRNMERHDIIYLDILASEFYENDDLIRQIQARREK
jgi:RimJ/RimL family protein N-acetyltransferase